MKPMCCFEVLLVILQVYHSSASDISDWLIRQGSPFDGPQPGPSYRYSFPVQKKNSRFPYSSDRNIPSFHDDYFKKLTTRNDDEKNYFLRPFSIPKYTNIHKSVSNVGGEKRTNYRIENISMHRKPDFLQTSSIVSKKYDEPGVVAIKRMFHSTSGGMHSYPQTRKHDEDPFSSIDFFKNMGFDFDPPTKKKKKTNKNGKLHATTSSKPVISHTFFIYPVKKNATRFKKPYSRKENYYKDPFESDSRNRKKIVKKVVPRKDRKKSNRFTPYDTKRKDFVFPENPYKFQKSQSISSPRWDSDLLKASLIYQTYDDFFNKMFNPIDMPFEHHRYKRSTYNEPSNIKRSYTSSKKIHEIKIDQSVKPVYEEDVEKYPYYDYYSPGELLEGSPIKYAENVNNIPQKSEGGTEFYDSKQRYCSEVESDVDAVPDRIKNKMPEDEDDDRDKSEFDEDRGKPRLNGLGDKIDCFKAKFFGVDPLDNPFFNEDTIEPPVPIQTPFHMSAPLKMFSKMNYDDINNFKPLKTTVTQLKPVQPKAQSRLWNNPNKPKTNKKNSSVKTDYIPRTSSLLDNTVVDHYNPIRKHPQQENIVLINYVPKRKTNILSNNIVRNNIPQASPIIVDNSVNHYTPKKKPILYVKAENTLTNYAPDKKPKVTVTNAVPNKETITLPDVLLDKYTQSRDAQTRVYGDIIGNIRSNLYAKQSEAKKTNSAFVPILLTTDSRKYRQPKINTGIYQSYTNKENIVNPNKRIRYKRDTHFVIGIPLRKQEANAGLKNETEVLVVPINQAAKSLISSSNFNPDNGQNSNIPFARAYTDIGKEERKHVEIPQETVLLETAAAIENEKINHLRNHRREYSPITTSKAITPEQLKAEIKHKSTERSEFLYTSKYPESTTLAYTPKIGVVTKPFANSSEIIAINDGLNQNINSSNTEYPSLSPGFQNENIRGSESIVNVSTHLPEPLYLDAQPLRHNYSSKYNLNTLLSKELQKDVKPNLEVESKGVTVPAALDTGTLKGTIETVTVPSIVTEIIRHTVEVKPTAEITSESYSFFPQQKNQNFEDIKIGTESSRADDSTKYYTYNYNKPYFSSTVRSKSRYTPSSDDSYNYYNTELPRRIKTSNRKRNNRIRIQKPKVTTTSTASPILSNQEVSIFDTKDDYDISKNIFGNLESIPKSIISSTERPTTVVSRRGRRPLKSYQRQFSHDGIDFDSPPRKPKIVEKTSTKRKTTVITNSKRYENNDNVDPNFQIPIEKQSTLIYNHETGDKISSPDELHESDTINHSREIVNAPIEESVFPLRETSEKSTYRGRKKPEKRRRPIKEESRYQEDVEEEEIIQERSTPYHGPELAKKVNQLLEAEEEGTYNGDSESSFIPDSTIKEPEIDVSYLTSDQGAEVGDLKTLSAAEETFNIDGNSDYRRARAGSGVLEDRGMSARILDSFASLISMASDLTPKPTFEKNPGERLYFYVAEN